jgi:hypothetical protein
MLFAFYAGTEIREEQLSNRQFLCTHILLQVEKNGTSLCTKASG